MRIEYAFAALMLLDLTGCATGKKTISIKSATEYTAGSFCIGFPDNGCGTRISNMKLTIQKDNSYPNRTRYALAFDVANTNQDVQSGRQGFLNVFLETATGAPVPELQNKLLNLGGWRDHCYYGGDGHRLYQGYFDASYEDFVRLVDHIDPKAVWRGSRLGRC